MQHTELDASGQQPVTESTHAPWKRWMDKHTIIYGHRYYCLPEALSRCNARDDVQISFPRPRFPLHGEAVCAVSTSSIPTSTDAWFLPHLISVYVVDNDVYHKLKCGKEG